MSENNQNKAGQVTGIIGIILGIIALIISFTCIGALAIIPGIVAIVLSAISLSQVNKSENGQKGLSIASLIISILATLIAILWLLFFSGAAIVGKTFLNDNPHIKVKLEKSFKDAVDGDLQFEDAMETLDETMETLEKKLDKIAPPAKIEKVDNQEKLEKLMEEDSTKND